MAHLCQWLSTVFLLFVLVSAGPVRVQKRHGVSLPLRYGRSAASGFNIRRKRSPSSIAVDLQKQLERVKLMYSDAPAPRSGHRKRLISVSANLTDKGYDLDYYTTVQVGTPPQSFSISVGTRAADFWVASQLCCSNTTISNKFNADASSTWNNSTQDFLIEYTSGNVTGWIGDDRVRLGNFTIPGQVMGVADYISEATLVKDPLSGFMGLGWEALGLIPGLPWWQNLMTRGVLQESLFGVYIARHVLEPDGGKDGPGGSLDFGFANKVYYTGNIEYSDLGGTPGYWKVAIQSLTINNHHIEAGSRIAALEIGGPFILAPTTVVETFYANVPNAKPGTGILEGLYVVSCNTNVGFNLVIKGVSYPVSVADWVFPLDPDTDTCIGLIAAYAGTRVQWVLGDAFLKNVYTVFRYDPPSVGFANLSDAVRYAGTGKSSTSSIPLHPSTSTSTTSDPGNTTVFVPPPSSTKATATTTSRGAGSRPGLPRKAALSACLLTMIMLSL